MENGFTNYAWIEFNRRHCDIESTIVMMLKFLAMKIGNGAMADVKRLDLDKRVHGEKPELSFRSGKEK